MSLTPVPRELTMWKNILIYTVGPVVGAVVVTHLVDRYAIFSDKKADKASDNESRDNRAKAA